MLKKSEPTKRQQKNDKNLNRFLSSLSNEQQEVLKGGGPPPWWWFWPPGSGGNSPED